MVKVATLNEILASRARATFAYRVNFDSISLSNSKEMENWCQQNCTGLWRSQSLHALYYQFENDYDAMMFMLRWGGASGNELK